MASATITNALTIDVEDYFQVSAFAPYIARADWGATIEAGAALLNRALAALGGEREELRSFIGQITERLAVVQREHLRGPGPVCREISSWRRLPYAWPGVGCRRGPEGPSRTGEGRLESEPREHHC